MAKFTPGPWKFEVTRQRGMPKGHEVYSEEAGTVVCFTDGLDPEAEANTNLIAAAPELLFACKAALFFSRNDQTAAGIATRRELRAAIAKAEGETE